MTRRLRLTLLLGVLVTPFILLFAGSLAAHAESSRPAAIKSIPPLPAPLHLTPPDGSPFLPSVLPLPGPSMQRSFPAPSAPPYTFPPPGKPAKVPSLYALDKIRATESEMFALSSKFDEKMTRFASVTHGFIGEFDLNILKAHCEQYRIPAQWFNGVKMWEDVGRNKEKDRKRLAETDFAKHGKGSTGYGYFFYLFHMDFLRWFLNDVSRRGFAWNFELEEMEDGVRRWKDVEKRLMERLDAALAAGQRYENLRVETKFGWIELIESSIHCRYEPPEAVHPMPKPTEEDFSLAASNSCARVAARKRLADYNFDQAFEPFVTTSYTRVFGPIGVNSLGKVMGAERNDKP